MSFSFRAEPAAAPHSRPLYRAPVAAGAGGAAVPIQVDPRVVRGPTVGRHAKEKAAAAEAQLRAAEAAAARASAAAARRRPHAAGIEVVRESAGTARRTEELASRTVQVPARANGPVGGGGGGGGALSGASEAGDASGGALGGGGGGSGGEGWAQTGPLASTVFRPAHRGAWQDAQPHRLQGRSGVVVIKSGVLSAASVTARGRSGDGSVYDYVDFGSAPRAVDLSAHLEEQKRAGEPEGRRDAACEVQEEVFVPRAPPARVLAPRTGVDTGTHMDAHDSGSQWAAPFDFAAEAEGLVEVIAAKTLEQALVEVREEAELQALAERRSDVGTALRLEEERVQRVQHEAQQRARQARRDIAEARKRAADAQSAVRKVAGHAVARASVDAALRRTLHLLHRQGFLAVPERTAAAQALPDVVRDADRLLAQRALARQVADDLIHNALRLQRHQRAQRELAEQRAQHAIILRIPWPANLLLRPPPSPRRGDDEQAADPSEGDDGNEGDGSGKDPSDAMAFTMRLPPKFVDVGPIPIARIDSVRDVQQRMLQWVDQHPDPLALAAVRGRRLTLCLDGVPLDPDATLLHLRPHQLQALSVQSSSTE